MQPNNPNSRTTNVENFLDFCAIEKIKENLSKQNRNKVGRPFKLLDSML